MADSHQGIVPGLDSPPVCAYTPTPSDTDPLPHVTRAIYVGTSGDLKVVLVGDTVAVVFQDLPVGMWPMRVKQIYSTLTTADGLLCLY